jgi:hypothetical protein
MNAFDLPVFGIIGRYAANWRALREQIRTERIMNALPPEVRKDIGWPELYAGRRARRG